MSALPALRHFTVVDVGDKTVATFTDAQITEDKNIIEPIGEELARLVNEHGRRKLMLNFKNVEFTSSRLIGKLPSLQNQLFAVQGKLVLCSLNPKLAKLFYNMKLDLTLTIVPDEEAGFQIL